MNRPGRLNRTLYALLLRLYPSEYYRVFGNELLEVFTTKLAHSSEFGRSFEFDIFLHEIIELPGNLISEHLAQINIHMKGDSTMSPSQRSRLFSLGVMLPLILVTVLAFVNLNFMKIFFMSGLGWLFMGSFVIMLALNSWLVMKRNLWRPYTVTMTTITAVLLLFVGPAVLRVINMVQGENGTLQITLSLGLILIDLAIATIALIGARRSNNLSGSTA